MLFWKDVGNGRLLDRPLPFKLHQSYRPLPCFIPALQDIWSDPAKNSAVMTVMTSTPRSHLITAVMRLSSQPYLTLCQSHLHTASKIFVRHKKSWIGLTFFSVFRIRSKHFERCFDSLEPPYKRTPKSRIAIVKFIQHKAQVHRNGWSSI